MALEKDARGSGHSLMAGLDFSRSIRELTPKDEGFHQPDASQPHWTETSWWGIASTRLGLGGWIYLRARPNLGIIACGIYFFDTRRQDMWNSIYHVDFHHVALPHEATYLNLTLDNGLHLTCEEPFKRHRIRYADNDFSLDLVFENVGAGPWPVGLSEKTGHFDQPMWATGTITCGDESFAIDDPAFRDRTWSGRSDNATCPLNFYTWGTTNDRSETFYAAAGGIIAGSCDIGGRQSTIVDIERTVKARDASGRPSTIVLIIKTKEGEAMELIGNVVLSYPVMALPRTLAWSSVVEWRMAGKVFTGEDHEGWSFDVMRANRRRNGEMWSKHI